MNSRLGQTNKNNKGSLMKIIEYNGYENILVEFQDEYKSISKTRYCIFLNGQISNPYDKTVGGVGMIGIGVYTDTNNKSKRYTTWADMLLRCYSNRYPTYAQCIVCDEWHIYQNFAKWYDENYYEIESEIINLDKDILVKGNKIYSPDNCVFVPRNINMLFVKANSIRGKYPIGVTYDKSRGKYCAKLSYKNKTINFGRFNTSKEAFDKYKEEKEKLIKNYADKYKESLPMKLYNILHLYNVEIDD